MSLVNLTPTELVDSRVSIEGLRRQSTGTRKWLCAWEDRFDTSWVPVPHSSKYTDGIDSGDTGSYEDRLVCRSVERKGVGAGRTVGTITIPKDGCIVTAEYAEKMPYNEVDVEYSAQGRIVTAIVGGQMVNIPFPIGRLQITKYFVFSIAYLPAWTAKLGTVNATQFTDYYGNVYAAGTLRFDEPGVTHYYDTTVGTLMQRAAFCFAHDPHGWNTELIEGTWSALAVPAYPTSDFSTIITPST